MSNLASAITPAHRRFVPNFKQGEASASPLFFPNSSFAMAAI
jgi:hypothetical protein